MRRHCQSQVRPGTSVVCVMPKGGEERFQRKCTDFSGTEVDVCFHQHSEFSWNSRCQMVCVAICIPFCSILSRWVVKAVPHGFGSRSPRFALSKGGCPSLLLGLVTCAEPLSCCSQCDASEFFKSSRLESKSNHSCLSQLASPPRSFKYD